MNTLKTITWNKSNLLEMILSCFTLKMKTEIYYML